MQQSSETGYAIMLFRLPAVLESLAVFDVVVHDRNDFIQNTYNMLGSTGFVILWYILY